MYVYKYKLYIYMSLPLSSLSLANSEVYVALERKRRDLFPPNSKQTYLSTRL